MVTKERLRELIRLCKTIYTPDKLWGTIGNIKLNKSFTINNNRLQANIKYEDMPNAIGYMSVPLEELYENQEDAEFIVKMHAERTEFFEPPIYEKFSTNKDSKFCFYKNGYKYVLHNALPMFESIRINKLTENENIIIFEQPLTKMNYIKACEYARNLFLGKENENETDSDR